MEVLDGLPQLSIAKEAPVVGYSRGGDSLPARLRPFSFGAGCLAEIAVVFESRGRFCRVCNGLDRTGLLRRIVDRSTVRAERIVLTCSACGDAFVRLDGRM